MKKKLTGTLIFIAGGLLIAGVANAQQAQPFSAKNKTVKVYVTEKGTDNRIAKTETLHFEDKPQPVETEVAVFVDPSKKFQTMVGIGGALTDASAETFYKLPKEKQKE